MANTEERAALRALVDGCGDIPWHRVASVVEMTGSTSRVLRGEADDADPAHDGRAGRQCSTAG